MAYTYEQIGQRAKERNPEQLANFSDAEIGQRIVERNPEAFKGVVSTEQPTTNQPAAAQPEKKGFIESLASPFVKMGATVAGVGSSIGQLLTGDVQGASEAINKERDFGILGSAKPLGVESYDPSQGVMGGNLGQFGKEVVGTGLELGSWLVPAGKVGAVGKTALTGVEQVAKGGLLQGAGTLGRASLQSAKMGALGGTLGASGATLAEGGTIADMAKSGLTGAIGGTLLGGAIPVVGKAAGSLARGVGRVGGELLGKGTQTGYATIKEAFTNPNVTKYLREFSGEGGVLNLQRKVVDDIKNAMDAVVNKAQRAYQQNMKNLNLSKIDMTNELDDVRAATRNLLDKYRVKIREGKKLNNLDFETLNSPINPEKGGGKEVQKAYNTLMRWTDTSAEGIDKLKRQLWDFVEGTERNSDGSNIFTKELWGATRNSLRNKVKGYEEMTGQWENFKNLQKDLTRAFGEGGKTGEEAMIKKFLPSFKQNNEFRRELLEVLEEASTEGGIRPDISGKAAAVLSSAAIPRGLHGTLGNISVIASLVNPANIPFMLLYLASTSPRLVAEAVSILGRVKGKTIPDSVKQELFNLLIQAERVIQQESQSTNQTQQQTMSGQTTPQPVAGGSPINTQQPLLGQFPQTGGFQGSNLPDSSPFA